MLRRAVERVQRESEHASELWAGFQSHLL
jgi:hypothetical protein